MKRRTNASYLRSLRRKSTLSQEDVAFLLGTFAGTRVTRHETGECIPPLKIGLAYEVIFGAGIADLYEDDVLAIAKDICTRARKLHDSLRYRRTDPLRAEKRAYLKRIIRRCSLNE
jgi:hypothetical protein